MFIYIFLFLIIFLVAYKEELPWLYRQDGNPIVYNNSYYHLILIILIFFSGLRDSIGGDTIRYMDRYRETPDLYLITSTFVESSRYSTFFVYLFSFFKTISEEFWLFQFCQALFVNTVMFCFLKKYCEHYYIGIICFILVLYLRLNMEEMREAISISLGLIFYYFYNKDKYKLAFVFLILAYLNHNGAIILLLIPFILKIRNSKKTIFIFLFFCIALPLVSQYIPFLNTLSLYFADDSFIENYELTGEIDADDTKRFVKLLRWYSLIPLLFIYLLKEKEFINNNTGILLFYTLLMCLSLYSPIFSRFAHYFAPFFCIFLSHIIFYFFEKYSICRNYSFFILLLLTIICFWGYGFRQFEDGLTESIRDEHINVYFPYKNILF